MIGFHPSWTLAIGLRIDSRMYDSSATIVRPPWSGTTDLYSPSRFGARLDVFGLFLSAS